MNNPETFPEYVPPRATSSYPVMLSVPTGTNQLINLQNVQQQQPQIQLVPVIFPITNSNLQIANRMMNSKRSTNSNYSQNSLMLNSANNQITGTSSKHNILQSLFTKKPKNKVQFANDYTENSKNLLQLQQIKPSSMLTGLFRSKKHAPLRSIEKSGRKEMNPQMQPIMPFGRPTSNLIPNNQYYMAPAYSHQRI